ncbi:MAG: hypothetical protein AAFW00_14200 [Bacteroidota bacterium]
MSLKNRNKTQQEISSQIKQYIIESDLEEAASFFSAQITDNKVLETNLIQLRGRLNALKDQEARGILSASEIQQETNKIRDGLLNELTKWETPFPLPTINPPKLQNRLFLVGGLMLLGIVTVFFLIEGATWQDDSIHEMKLVVSVPNDTMEAPIKDTVQYMDSPKDKEKFSPTVKPKPVSPTTYEVEIWLEDASILPKVFIDDEFKGSFSANSMSLTLTNKGKNREIVLVYDTGESASYTIHEKEMLASKGVNNLRISTSKMYWK